MRQITLSGWHVDVQDLGPGVRGIVMTEQPPSSGDVIVLPLPEEVAVDLGRKLQGSSIVKAPASALHIIGRG